MKVQQLLISSLRKIGAIAAGETPSSDDLCVSMESLNKLLYELSIAPDGVYRSDIEDFSLVAGTQKYTIGVTGTLATVRPVRLKQITISSTSGFDSAIEEINETAWAGITNKTQAGEPQKFLHRPAYPNADLWFWRVPDKVYTVTIYSDKPLAQYNTLADELNLPPEYEPMLTWNLAVNVAPEFGIPASQEVVYKAQQAWQALQRHHGQVIPQVISAFSQPSGSFYDIYTGD
jgi:hypothetical protein